MYAKLHPKYTTYEKLDETRILSEIEKAFTKVRWQHKNEDRKTKGQIIEREDWKDLENNKIDLRKLSSTDLPFNSRVYLPEAVDDKKELEMHMLKEKLKVVVKDFKNQNKKSRSNITKEQLKGIKSLQKRRDNGEIVIYQTDKSARIAVDTTSNYIKSMEPHVETDEIVSEKTNKDVERLINAHAVCWLRFTQAGQQTEDLYRIKMSMQSKNNEPSCLYSLRKDHKENVLKD